MASNAQGLTPLHLAAMEAMTPETIQTLLNAGADKNAKDYYYKTPWEYAKENKHLRFNEDFSTINEKI